jgi:WD40 repeat protein
MKFNQKSTIGATTTQGYNFSPIFILLPTSYQAISANLEHKIANKFRAPVLCVEFNDRYILSGSSDSTIRVCQQCTILCSLYFKVWTADIAGKYNCKHVLKDHSGAVRCIKFDNSKIVSGSEDLTVKLWKLNSGEITTLYRHGYYRTFKSY